MQRQINTLSNPSRRRFAQTMFYTAVLGGVAFKESLGQIIGKMAPTPANGLVKLKFSDFPDLQTVGGSIMINVPGTGGSLEPLIVTRSTSTKVYAVSSICTHQGCQVNTFDPSIAAMQCPCHGSRFSASGGVIRGPAGRALKSYTSTIEGDFGVSITIPGIAYVITGTLILNNTTGARRFKLDIPTAPGQVYRILFGSSLREATEWKVVPFSLSLDAPADTENLFPDSTLTTVYVDAPEENGFFQVAEN